MQTIAAKGLHPTLFLAPTSFTSLLDGEGQNPENSQACAQTILDVKGSISFNQKKKKKGSAVKQNTMKLITRCTKSLHTLG